MLSFFTRTIIIIIIVAYDMYNILIPYNERKQ